MLATAIADLITFFYPIGNTPAACLTQCLPREKPADILLLGAGDVRNILFTAYSDARALDITSCDLSAAVVARNILLLSLIIDDPLGERDTENWNIYYHLKLDPQCHDRLRAQATRLLELGVSMDAWQASKYGKLIKFCDKESLVNVNKVWAFYVSRSAEENRSAFEASFKTGLKRTKKMGGTTATSVVLTGLRSSAPTVTEALTDTADLFAHFWKHGTTDMGSNKAPQCLYANPMFASPHPASTLHYGLDPLLGFHLATAYVPLTKGSPLSPSPPSPNKLTRLQRVVAAAHAEFSLWSDAFRKRAHDTFTLRVFVGDALPFSHALQCRRMSRGVVRGNHYSNPREMVPLALEEKGYGPAGSAPVSFNVIDTSNLADHVGALNLLTATTALLRGDPSATLYTEVLVGKGKSVKEFIGSLLSGHLPTVALLLGLSPVDYWTNTAATSTDAENMTYLADNAGSPEDSMRGQVYCRITWKRPMALQCSPPPTVSLQPLRFDEDELASILKGVYLNMFSAEDIARTFANFSIQKVQEMSLPVYQRASFVAFLRLVKDNVDVNWHKLMDILLDLIGLDTKLILGSNYIQELFLSLHLHGLFSVDTLKTTYNTHASSTENGLARWRDMPPVVCVTIRVPRSALGALVGSDPADIGTVPICCSVQSSPAPMAAGKRWQNMFAAVQTGFGKLTTSGTRHSNDFNLHITADQMAWTDGADLFASFMAPTWMLLIEPRTAEVALGVQSTPGTAATKLMGRLGLNLDVFKTTLGDHDHVYITTNPPNQSGRMIIPGIANEDISSKEIPDVGVRTVSAKVDETSGMLTTLLVRVDITADGLKSMLAKGCVVKTTHLSPCAVRVSIGDVRLDFGFPAPVMEADFKTRIARKSSYIELVGPVNNNVNQSASQSLTYPVAFDGVIPTNLNVTYVNLHTLPILDVSSVTRLQWLNTHVSLMFHKAERRIRDNPSAVMARGLRARFDFKDSLHTLFNFYAGLQGASKCNVFGIHNKENGGVHMILFVSAMRLDMASRTVVLDLAVLPLYTELMPRILHVLHELQSRGIRMINVDDDELTLWKAVLPAFVERCRTWGHAAKCEYVAAGRAPLSKDSGKRLLCSCGDGVFPDKFGAGIPMWSHVSKYCVRAAISPAFYCPLVEDRLVWPSDDKKGALGVVDECRACHRSKAANGRDLLKCARCQAAKYCSSECQRADWKNHKGKCVAPRK